MPARHDTTIRRLTNARLPPGPDGLSRPATVILRGGLVAAVTSSPAGPPEPTDMDCRGRSLLPGFVDAHGHLLALAENLVSLDLGAASGVSCLADLLARVKAQADLQPPGTLVRAKGYDEFRLTERRHPTRQELDQAAPRHPVKLSHRSGHLHVLNSPGLELAGIDDATPEPPGGFIDRLVPSGQPSGLVYHLGGLLARRLPPLEPAALELGLDRAERSLLSRGVTAVHDASAHNNPRRWVQIADRKAAGRFRPRVFMMLGEDWLDWLASRREEHSPAKDGSRPHGIKVILENDRGRLSPGVGELADLIRRGHRAGLPVAVHAVEETAIAAAADAFAQALSDEAGPGPGHRLEHCALCHPELAARLARLGLGVVAQPGFIHHHGDRYLETVLPADRPHLYPFRTFLDQGVRLAAGSDFPLVPADPLTAMSTAVTRRTVGGRLLNPDQALSRWEAVAMHTTWAARAMGHDDLLGSLAPGRPADLVVLGGDIGSSPPEEWPSLGVALTMVGGRVAWSAED